MNPNPCFRCPKINEDKNNRECARCKKRIRYVNALSNHSGLCLPKKSGPEPVYVAPLPDSPADENRWLGEIS